MWKRKDCSPNLRFGVLAVALSGWLVSFEAGAQFTNSVATNRPAALQVWDFSAELGLSETQSNALQQLKRDYENAREEMRKVTSGELPPDVQQSARQAYAEKFRAVNRRISELLTDGQKKKFAEQRAASRPTTRASRPATNATASAVRSLDDDESPGTNAVRLPPRALLTDDDYRKLAAELRAAYTQPPAQWPKPEIDDGVKFVELGLLPPVRYPTNNPYSAAKAELGKQLFFDPRVSGSGHIACASCHDAELGWGDGRAVSFGHARQPTKRNAPSLLNAGHGETFFWDGRAGSLEEQARDVLGNADEMHSGPAHIREHLAKISGYTNEFAKAFGDAEVSLLRALQALATFERTITSRANAFDSFQRGNTNALSDEAVRGLHLFRTTARCANCHHGPNFTDHQFHNLGLSYYGRKLEDLGRYHVTKRAEDVGAFKTPTLRNLSRTAPYMHNGLFDLDGVLNLYNAGMPALRRKESEKNDPLFPTKSKHLRPLALNRQDTADLKAFLESLTETRARVRPPELPADGNSAPLATPR